jgi:proteic killer suppression protein
MFTVDSVIRTFANAETQRFWEEGRSRRLPVEIRKRTAMRLVQLDAATRLADLRWPPSNRLEPLRGECAGQWSIRINDQWRLCFRFRNGDAFNVEITDYH